MRNNLAPYDFPGITFLNPILPTIMVTLLIILGLAFTAGLVFLATAVWTAPDGYQDSDGYHFDQSPDAR